MREPHGRRLGEVQVPPSLRASGERLPLGRLGSGAAAGDLGCGPPCWLTTGRRSFAGLLVSRQQEPGPNFLPVPGHILLGLHCPAAGQHQTGNSGDGGAVDCPWISRSWGVWVRSSVPRRCCVSRALPVPCAQASKAVCRKESASLSRKSRRTSLSLTPTPQIKGYTPVWACTALPQKPRIAVSSLVLSFLKTSPFGQPAFQACLGVETCLGSTSGIAEFGLSLVRDLVFAPPPPSDRHILIEK